MSIILFVKYLLLFFSILFTLIGIAISIAGVMLQLLSHQYSTFLNENFSILPVIIMVAGGVILVTAFFGIWGTLSESLCMLSTFIVFLITIFVMEITTGVGIYVFHNVLKDVMAERMDSSLKYYDTDEQIAKSWDILQTSLHCCGINGTDDWKDKVPPSCCPYVRLDEECQRKDAFVRGCLTTIFSGFGDNSLFAAVIAATIAFVQMMGIGFTCCLVHSIHKGYETV